MPTWKNLRCIDGKEWDGKKNEKVDQHEIKFRAWDSENVEKVEKLVREKQSLEKLVILCLHEMGKLEVGDDLLRCASWDDWKIVVSRDPIKLTTIWKLKKQDKEGK